MLSTVLFLTFSRPLVWEATPTKPFYDTLRNRRGGRISSTFQPLSRFTVARQASYGLPSLFGFPEC